MTRTSVRGPFDDVSILVAEDDRAMADMLERGLTARSFEVECVDRVMDGLDEIDKADLMILDIRLLNGDGRQLLYRWVREKRQPVLVISGVLGPNDEEELLTLGAWNVLPKPFKMDTFFCLMERYAYVVKDRRRSAQVGKLQRQVKILMYLVLAFGGVEIIPRLLSLFGVDLTSILSLF